MFQQTPKKQVLFKRTLATVVMGVFSVAAILYGGFVLSPSKASAATNSNIGFQARLEGAGGNIAPDGYYNIKFRLYTASSGGASIWSEEYYDANGVTAGQDNRVQVINGYVTVNLGSQTAFPGTINWDQNLWLTMDVGGTTQTATPTYDGEMNPRLALTGVPYAFRAGKLATFGSTYTSTLELLQPTVGNQTFQVADQAAAGTYTICVQGAAAANGGCAASTGGSGYIQNQYASAQSNSNFWIQSAGSATIATATIQQASGQTGDLITFKNTGGTATAAIASNGDFYTAGLLDRYTAGTLNIGTNIATGINLNQNVTVAAAKTLTVTSAATSLTGATSGDALTVSNSTSTGNIALFKDNATTVASIADGGAVLFKNSTDSATAFRVQDAAGTTNLILADTLNNTVDIHAGSLTVYGGTTFAGWASAASFYSPTFSRPDGNGTRIDLLQNGAAQLTSRDSNPAQVIQINKGSAGQMADLMQYQDANGAVQSGVNANGGIYTNGGNINSPYGGFGNYGNLLTFSEHFENSDWSTPNSTETADDGASNPAPNGTTTADKIVSSATDAKVTQTYSTSTNGTYTFSVWLKSNSGTPTVDMRINSTGATPTTGTTSTYTLSTTWQRYSVTQTFTGTPSNIKPEFEINANSTTIVAWGGQMVPASTPGVYTTTSYEIVDPDYGSVVNGYLRVGGAQAGLTLDARDQSGNQFDLYSSAGELAFYGGLNIRGAITAGGNFGIGLNNDTPTSRLSVTNDVAQNIFQLTDTTAGGPGSINVLTVADEGGTTFRNRTDSSAAFAIQQADGDALFTVDTSGSGQIKLGTASDTTGVLSFLNSGGANAVTIKAGSGSAAIDFTLPTAVATTGDCVKVGTVSGASVPLTFAACGGAGSGGVTLQGSTPGTPDTGNINVSGTIIGGTALQTAALTATGQSILGGGSNQIQLIVKGNASQSSSNPLIMLRNSSNTELARINSNTNGDLFFGWLTGQSLSGGSGSNTGVGNGSLQTLSTGSNNTAFGNAALSDLSTTGSNTAVGYSAAAHITGNDNVAVGKNALKTPVASDANVAIGSEAGNVTGAGASFYNNTFIGKYAGFIDSDNFATTATLQHAAAIGADAQVQASNSLVLGSIGTDGASKVGIGSTIPLNTFSVSPLDYNTGTAYQSGTTITGVGTTWTAAYVGEQFVFATGETATITARASNTSLTASVSQSVSSNPGIKYRIHHVGFQVTSAGAAYVQQTSSTAFAVQNTAGTNVLAVDTTNGLNLITNGSFEGSVGTTGWALKTGSTISQNTSVAAIGQASLQVATSTSAGSGAKYNVTLSSSTQYTLSLYAKLSSGSMSTLDLGYAQDGSTETSPICTGKFVGSDGFYRLDCTFTTGTVSGTPYLFLKQSDAGTARTLYIDGVQLQTGNSYSAYRDGKLYANGVIAGALLLQNDTNSSTAFEVKAVDNSTVLDVDTKSQRVGIGSSFNSSTPAAKLDIYTGDTLAFQVNQTNTANTIVKLQSNGTDVTTISGTGAATFKNSANSTAAFQVQNAAAAELIGADTTNSIVRLLNNNTGTVPAWTNSANALPAGRHSHASATANGYVYVVGGSDGSDVAQDDVYYAKVNANGSIGTWASTTLLPANREDHTTVVANGYIYAIGGNNDTAPQNTVYYAKLNPDGTVGTWNTTTVLPSARSQHTSVMANGYVYVIGGVDANSVSQSTVYYAKLNPDGTVGTWNTTTAMAATRINHASAVANGYLYNVAGSVGGSDSTQVAYAKLNTDGTVGSWSTTSALANTNYHHTAAVLNGYLYSIGGQYDGDYSKVFYAQLNADGTIGSWTQTTSMNTTRRNHSTVVVNGRLLSIGGQNGSPLSSQEYVSPTRVTVGGSLDLVSLSGENLAEGGSGGNLTAGDTYIAGALTVTDAARFVNGVWVGGDLSVGGKAAFRNVADSTTAFQVQGSSGSNYINVNTRTTDNNLWPNPSFEQNINGVAAHNTGTVTHNGTDVAAQYGSSMLKLVTGATNNNGAEFRYPFKGSTQYNISLWMRVDSGGPFTNINIGYNETGSDTDCATSVSVSTTWAQYTCTSPFTTGTTMNGTSTFYVKVNSATSRTIYIDGVTLVAGATALPYSLPGSALQVEPFANQVVINAGNNAEIQPWKQSPNQLGGNRDRPAVTTANGYIYVLGGGTGTNGGTPQTTVYYAKVNADGTTGAFSTTTALSAGVSGGAATVSNGYLYLIGGNDGSNDLDTVRYARLNADGTIGSWATTTVLTQTRDYPGVSSYAGYIQVYGGNNGSTTLGSTLYGKVNPDGTISSWTTGSSFASSNTKEAFQAVVSNGYVYLPGGTNTNFATATTTVDYAPLNSDGSIGTWVAGTALPAARGKVSAVAMNGNVYVFGGWDGTNSVNTVYYAPILGNGSLGSWVTSANPLPTANPTAAQAGMQNSRAVVVNGYAYMAGGDNTSAVGPMVGYTSGARVKLSGSLDLLGSGSGNLVDSSGGQLTAGNTNIVGNLQVADSANFLRDVSITGQLTVGGNVNFRTITNSTTAFTIQTTAGVNLFVADTSSTVPAIKIGGGDVSTSTAPTILVLDHDTDSTEPTGIDGAMYYNEVLAAFRCYQDGNWRNCTGSLGTEYMTIEDDFVGQGYYNNCAYIYNIWVTYNSVGTCGSAANIIQNGNGTYGGATRPGVEEIITTTTSGNGTTLISQGLDYTNMKEMTFVFRVPTITTMKVRAGMIDDGFTTNGQPAGGIYFQYDSAASANWRCITRNSGTETNTDSGTAVGAGTWYKLSLKKNGSSQWVCSINDVAMTPNASTNNPTSTSGGNFGFQVITNTTATRQIDVDYARLMSTRISQRY